MTQTNEHGMVKRKKSKNLIENNYGKSLSKFDLKQLSKEAKTVSFARLFH